MLLLAGCMNAPVLDSARVVRAGGIRYDAFGSLPIDGRPVTPDDPGTSERDLSDRERWRRVGRASVSGIAAHYGQMDGRLQIDLSFASNLMLGFGGKYQLIDREHWAMAIGGQAHGSLIGGLIDDIPKVIDFAMPLWIGLEPAPWLSLYFTERLQVWWVEVWGATALASQTLGFRVGGDIGMLAEATYILEPFHASGGFQVAFAFYVTTFGVTKAN
jgi:hypothetical protein